MQTHNVISRVNVHSLRPVFHRVLTARSRIVNVATTRGIPPDAFAALDKIRNLIDGPIELRMHRMVPFETTDPGIKDPIAVMCVARENAIGGVVTTKTKKIELFPGQMVILPEDVSTWYISAIQEINAYEDTFVDVVWCARTH